LIKEVNIAGIISFIIKNNNSC